MCAEREREFYVSSMVMMAVGLMIAKGSNPLLIYEEENKNPKKGLEGGSKLSK